MIVLRGRVSSPFAAIAGEIGGTERMEGASVSRSLAIGPARLPVDMRGTDETLPGRTTTAFLLSSPGWRPGAGASRVREGGQSRERGSMMAYHQQNGLNLWHRAHAAARAAGLDGPSLFMDVYYAPKRDAERTPRDVYIEMLHWAPEQWRQWAAGIADEQAAHDHREDRQCQTFPL
jgi:hypothetical protein